MTDPLPPIRKQIRVPVRPEIAFRAFLRMEAWMPESHTLLQEKRQDILLEQHSGGRWVERGTEGTERDWGKVLACEPPRRLLLAWQIGTSWAYEPELLTEVEITFTEDGDGTVVELEHRNIERMGEGAADVWAALGSDQGWSGDLAGYVRYVSEGM